MCGSMDTMYDSKTGEPLTFPLVLNIREEIEKIKLQHEARDRTQLDEIRARTEEAKCRAEKARMEADQARLNLKKLELAQQHCPDILRELLLKLA